MLADCRLDRDAALRAGRCDSSPLADVPPARRDGARAARGHALLVSGEARQWLFFALWSGIGLEAKYTIAAPLAAFVIGCLLWRRDLFLRREAALGGLIALALVIP